MIAAGICEKGDVRDENQDSILISHNRKSGLFIVADGVGGLMNGSKVSHHVTESFQRWWEDDFCGEKQQPFKVHFDAIKIRTEQINYEICSRYGPGNSCSTIALLFIHQGIYGYLSSGDSRIYHCGREGVRMMTRDDVWENCPNVEENSVHAGKIISAIGVREELEYSCATSKVQAREIFMLCSDGIYKFVDDSVISDCLQQIYSGVFLRKRAIKELAVKAAANGSDDNYSVIVLKI